MGTTSRCTGRSVYGRGWPKAAGPFWRSRKKADQHSYRQSADSTQPHRRRYLLYHRPFALTLPLAQRHCEPLLRKGNPGADRVVLSAPGLPRRCIPFNDGTVKAKGRWYYIDWPKLDSHPSYILVINHSLVRSRHLSSLYNACLIRNVSEFPLVTVHILIFPSKSGTELRPISIS